MMTPSGPPYLTSTLAWRGPSLSRPRAWFISSLGLEWASSSFLATTGITQAETAGVPELEDLRTAIVEEALAVAAAKGVTLEYPDPLPNIRAHVASKRTKPSMLQHIEAGRRTEIDAIIGGDYYMAPDSIPMKTGDILLFHKLTFHSSRENRTQRARWNVDIRFMANPACRILYDEERDNRGRVGPRPDAEVSKTVYRPARRWMSSRWGRVRSG